MEFVPGIWYTWHDNVGKPSNLYLTGTGGEEMIKKTMTSGIFVLAILAFSGCSLFGKSNQSQSGNQGQSGAPAAQESQSVAGDIKKSLFDLMTTGAGVKCSVEDQNGKYTMYAKGDKVKVEGFDYAAAATGSQQKAEKGTMINDGTWAYIWSGKEGIKFNIKEMEDLAPKGQNQANNSETNASDWKDWVKDLDQSGAKHDCSAAILSDADFTPPADVKFQDWGEMMKGLLQGFQQNVPGGGQNVPQNIPQ